MENLKFFGEVIRDYYKGNVFRLILTLLVVFFVVLSAIVSFKVYFGAGIGWLLALVLFISNEFTFALSKFQSNLSDDLKFKVKSLFLENAKLKEENKGLRKDMAWPAEVAAREN